MQNCKYLLYSSYRRLNSYIMIKCELFLQKYTRFFGKSAAQLAVIRFVNEVLFYVDTNFRYAQDVPEYS